MKMTNSSYDVQKQKDFNKIIIALVYVSSDSLSA